jgi:methylmalonyl-CoA mutase
MDPAEGSWFMESLTESLAHVAWKELRRLDAAGGIVAEIESGELSRHIADAASARHERVLERRQPIIGVSEHPVPGEVAQRSAQEIVEEASGGLLPFRPDALPFEVLRDGELAR